MNIKRIILNSWYSTLNGLISALYVVLAPAVLVRVMGKSDFSAWIFIIQTAGYIGYFSFGLQTAISRFVAIDIKSREWNYTNEEILVNGCGVVFLLGMLGAAVITSIVMGTEFYTSGIEIEMRQTVKWLFPFSAVCSVLLLVISGINGYFVGIKNNKSTLYNNLILKGGLLFGLIGAGVAGGDLWVMMAIYVAAHVFALVSYVFPLSKNNIKISYKKLNTVASRNLTKYCIQLSTWTLSSVMIYGYSTALISRYDYDNMAQYALMLSTIVMATGFHGAAFGNLLPEFAENFKNIGYLKYSEDIIKSTKYSSLFLVVALCLLIGAFEVLAKKWLGPLYNNKSSEIFLILSSGMIFRLIATPYALHLLATNQQRNGTYTVLVEGAANALFSTMVIKSYGAIGVAYGMLFGAMAGVLLNIMFNFNKDKYAKINKKLYFIDCVVKPVLCAVPCIVFYMVNPGSVYIILATMVSIFFALFLVAGDVKIWKAST